MVLREGGTKKQRHAFFCFLNITCPQVDNLVYSEIEQIKTNQLMMCSFGLVSTARLQLMLDQANTNTPFNPFNPLQFLFSAQKKDITHQVSLFSNEHGLTM